MNSHIRLFNRISRFYGWFFKTQKKHYLNHVIPKLPFELRGLSVIDIGAGTGALSSAMKEVNANVVMLDGSPKMLSIAEKKQADQKIPYVVRDVLKDDLTDLGRFDMAISAYLAHGLNQDDRQILYQKMRQLSSRYIVFYEHRKSRNIFIKFIEWLERGDYFNYVKVAEEEITEYFKNLTVINVTKRSVLYIIDCDFDSE